MSPRSRGDLRGKAAPGLRDSAARSGADDRTYYLGTLGFAALPIDVNPDADNFGRLMNRATIAARGWKSTSGGVPWCRVGGAIGACFAELPEPLNATARVPRTLE